MRTLPALILACVFVTASAEAEKVPMSKEALRKTATHVVTGEVKAIYVREVREGDWKYTRRIAEVAIDAVEKGEGLEKGGLVYVRYWKRRWVGSTPMPPSTGGHVGLPKEGDTLRIYLARNAYDGAGKTTDGGYNVVFGNGFEPLP